MHKERQRRDDLEPSTPATSALDESEQAEVARLRREVQEFRIDNELLGKAAAFFASKPYRKSGMN